MPGLLPRLRSGNRGCKVVLMVWPPGLRIVVQLELISVILDVRRR